MSVTRPPHTCVVGLGWGDEGKGKIVDRLASDFDIVVRFNGGANAGHTVCIGDQTFALHLLPSGVLQPDVVSVIGPGVVIDPAGLCSEIEEVTGRGITIGDALRVSSRAHVVMPYHKIEDRLAEDSAAGDARIGTTARGIGPCYADKMRRNHAVRMCDLLHLDRLRERLAGVVRIKQKGFRAVYGTDGDLDFDAVWDELVPAAGRLARWICDTTSYLARSVDAGRRLLFEGANGTLLDIDHGTYPFVTSSSTGGHGVAAGAGVPPGTLGRVIGVAKAYATRVGSGPFVTELDNEIGDDIRQRGHEYGTTTGRPRRCGWFDAVAARYAVRIAGVTELALMHLDTLSGLDSVGICVGYRLDGQPIDGIPADADDLGRVEPVYEYATGWHGDLAAAVRFDDLPTDARAYIGRIETLVGVPVQTISVGPERLQTVERVEPGPNVPV